LTNIVIRLPGNIYGLTAWPRLVRVKLNFLNAFNAILPVQSLRGKYSSCADGQINAISFGRPALFQEGRFAIVTKRWARDAVDAAVSKDERQSCGRRNRVVPTSRR
jgi:hypothetical protein